MSNVEVMAKRDLVEQVKLTRKMIMEKFSSSTEEYKGVKIVRLTGEDITLPIHSDSCMVSPRGYEPKQLKGRKLKKRIEGILSYIKRGDSCSLLHNCFLGNSKTLGSNGVLYCLYPNSPNSIDAISNTDMGSVVKDGVFSGAHMLAQPYYADGTVDGIVATTAAEYCEVDILNTYPGGVVCFDIEDLSTINPASIEAAMQIGSANHSQPYIIIIDSEKYAQRALERIERLSKEIDENGNGMYEFVKASIQYLKGFSFSRKMTTSEQYKSVLDLMCEKVRKK